MIGSNLLCYCGIPNRAITRIVIQQGRHLTVDTSRGMSPAITANNIATMIATHNLLSTKRQELLLLSNQKQSLETEAEAIISELTSQQPDSNVPPMGIDTPLVDSEGYPRADIDIYRARHLRKRLHEIRNDHKELERRIGSGLLELNVLQQQQQQRGGDANASSSISNGKDEAEEIKARRAPKPKPKYDAKTGKWVVKSWDGSVAGIENGETRSFDDFTHNSEGALASIATTSRGEGSTMVLDSSSGERNSQVSTTTPQQTARRTPQQQTLALTPFAIIDEVFSNSPSEEAGIQTGDLLLRFGSVTADNHHGFDAIKRAIVTQLSLAAANEESISIAVRRSTVELGGVAEMIRTEIIDLKPRQWAGKGLLGCHLQEYKE